MVTSEGTKVPNFEFTNTDGKKVFLHDLPGKKVVYFFPRAFSEACTEEALGFKKSYPDLKNLGVSTIIGVSINNHDVIDKFKEELELPFPVISDHKKEISKKFEVLHNRVIYKYAKRVTFVISETNCIEKVFENGFFGEETERGISNHGTEVEYYIGASQLASKLGEKLALTM